MCNAGSFLRHKKEFKRKKKVCDRRDTRVVIVVKDHRYKICGRCWRKISRSKVEW